MKRKLATALVIIAVIITAVVWVIHAVRTPIVLAEPVSVTIVKGDKAAQIAAKLDQAGLLRSRWLFIELARWRRIDRNLRPGRYRFSGPTSMRGILDDLRSGRAVVVTVTIPEGWTIARMAPHLSAQLGFDSAAFVSATRDSAMIRHAGTRDGRLEGYLWPETYQFYWGVEPREVVLRMVDAARHIFTDSLEERARALRMDRHMTLTLASLIEAEAAAGNERTRISGVFHNRLAQGMLLQCDPTVIYALGGLPNGRLLQEGDLTYDSPYNTYMYPGLPPGPIGNPGMASIAAALYPDSTKDLYFVADGHGGHIFSRTLEAHNRACVLVKRAHNR